MPVQPRQTPERAGWMLNPAAWLRGRSELGQDVFEEQVAVVLHEVHGTVTQFERTDASVQDEIAGALLPIGVVTACRSAVQRGVALERGNVGADARARQDGRTFRRLERGFCVPIPRVVSAIA